MAAQPLYILEAVDLRRADEPDSSRAISIKSLTLPGITRKSSTHSPGGGVGDVDHVFPQINAIEPKFSVAGIDRDILQKFGFAAGVHDKWVFAGAFRNKQTTKMLPVRAIIQGVIADWSTGDFSIGEIVATDYTLKEVTHYEIIVDGNEDWYWDFYEREGRANGVSWMRDIRIALGG